MTNYEERPGSGPAIGSDPNVLTVMFVGKSKGTAGSISMHVTSRYPNAYR